MRKVVCDACGCDIEGDVYQFTPYKVSEYARYVDRTEIRALESGAQLDLCCACMKRVNNAATAELRAIRNKPLHTHQYSNYDLLVACVMEEANRRRVNKSKYSFKVLLGSDAYNDLQVEMRERMLMMPSDLPNCSEPIKLFTCLGYIDVDKDVTIGPNDVQIVEAKPA